MTRSWLSRCLIGLLLVSLAFPQVKPPAQGTKPPPEQAKPAPAAPEAAKPQAAGPPQAEAAEGQTAAPEAQPAAEQTEGAGPESEAAKPAPAQVVPVTPPSPPTGSLSLEDASLVQVIDALCRQLKINYILDPRVEGSVTLNTYGEVRNVDTRSLLDLILRINGAAMVQVGEIYRIVICRRRQFRALRPGSARGSDGSCR